MFAALGRLIQGSEQEQLQKKFEEDRKGSAPVAYDIDDINFDYLRRKRAFIQGVDITLQEEFDKEQLLGFDSVPDLLPIVPKGNLASIKFDELMRPIQSGEESKAATPGGSTMFDYDS